MKRTPLTRKTPMPRGKALVRTTAPAKASIKLPKCAAPGCRARFVKLRPTQEVCGEACAQALVESRNAKAARLADKQRKAAEKLERASDKERRQQLGGRPYWLKRAEKAVNRYVRARDRFKGCISCDKPAGWDGQWHASHFRSVAAASSVRYHLWNIQKACWICNKHHSGNIGEYGPRLVALIGQERVDWLKAQNGRADYPIPYLQRLTSVMNRKALRQEKRNAMQG